MRQGEATTDDGAGFSMMTGFLAPRSPRHAAGRGPGVKTGFAPKQEVSFPPDIALAYNSLLKAPPGCAVLEPILRHFEAQTFVDPNQTGPDFQGGPKNDRQGSVGEANCGLSTIGNASLLDRVCSVCHSYRH